MAYTYYQSTSPRMWGTPQFQFTRPPTPHFEPQSHWSGLDYFRAHAVHDDPTFYQSIVGRMAVAVGSGYHEARHWHRRIYGGQVMLAKTLPPDIGSAAGYEAYRIWKHHHPFFEPLGGNREREREAMIGIAIGEATHLWHYSGRSLDNLGLRGACETAAATASRIATRIMGVDGYSNAEMSNYGRAPSYDSYNDDYATRPRALRRRSSYSVGLSTVPGASYGMGATGYAPPASPWAGTMSMARSTTPLPVTQGAYVQPGMGGIGVVPGNPGTYMGAPGVLGSAYGAGTTVGTYPGGILPTGVPVPYSANTVSAVYPAGPVGTVYPAAPPTYSAGQYAVNQYRGGVAPAPPGVYGPGYASIMPVPGYNTYAGQSGGRAGSTIISRQPRHHHHHHHRSHSMDRY